MTSFCEYPLVKQQTAATLRCVAAVLAVVAFGENVRPFTGYFSIYAKFKEKLSKRSIILTCFLIAVVVYYLKII